MQLLAHRGFWRTPDERNALAAFTRAFDRGWGIEIDVRDRQGALVVSHDVPDADAPTFGDVLAARAAAGGIAPLAVNVKADGLQALLRRALEDLPASHWFAFDMSIPDTLACLRASLPVFTRHSDVEPDPLLYADAGGVWLDDFAGGFVTRGRIAAHLAAGKRVAVVSPELHGRDHRPVWAQWRTWDVWASPDVLLCTDHPDEAQEVLA